MKNLFSKINSLLVLFAIFMMSCQNSQTNTNTGSQEPGSQKAEVKEVIQTSSYTYLRVEKNNQDEWIAINSQDIQKGAIVYYENGLKMENFTSPELQRTFETIYFVQEISDSPIQHSIPPGMQGNQPQKPVLSKLDIQIEQPEGGITIAELYSKRETYSGKMIKVRGQVTKVNLAIMERNWVHIQDGTSDGENFDLTITTDSEPKVGDILTFSGTLVLNKDFGSGYSYELLLEAAMPVELY
jgi:hypothetical protein